MIRSACQFRGLTRCATVVSRRSNSTPTTSRALRTFSSAVQHTEDDSLPSNLTIDRRSSFAPKERAMLVPPKEDDDEVDDDDVAAKKDDDDDDVQEAEHEHDDDEEDDEEEEDIDVSVYLDTPRYAIPLPDRLKANVHYGVDGSVTGTLHLDPTIFGVDPIRIDLIKQSVDYIRNKIRGRRKAKSKTVSEVRGSGRKVRQQKGSGRARAGHSRPAHWRGGAKAHGPKNTVDYGDVKMNKKARRLAMLSVLSQKLKEGNLIVVDNLMLASHKTSALATMLDTAYGIGKEGGSSALVLDSYFEPEKSDGDADTNTDTFHASYNGVPINVWVAAGNIHKIKVANQRFANVFEILKKDKLILTLSALEQMEKRWKD
jgi:large subunit ribosomal protein L4